MDTSQTSNNKRIAKNTLVLYVRMIFVVCISLYTSRVILEVLGVEDFGIYNIVGGIVSMMSFLNAAMSGATARFLTFEMGRGNIEKLRLTFNAAIQVHIAIAIIIIIIGETLGLWFVNTQLVIPEIRMEAANIVYQMSLIIMVLTVIQAPCSATIIAHERMDIYAYIEIAYSILKLAIVFLLLEISWDRLILYSILLAIIAFAVFLMYTYYSFKKYKECNLDCRNINLNIIKPLLKFSGLDLFGNASTAIALQGRNILINQFFGVVFNAASGVAAQASSAVTLFANNVTMAFRPQIIKEYSVANYARMQQLISMACRISIILMGLILIPLYVNIEYIMLLWLKTVPQNAVPFCRLMLLQNAIILINNIILIGIYATGKIKYLSIVGGTFYLLTIPISYIAFMMGGDVNLAYIISVIQMILTVIIDCYILQKQIPNISITAISRQLVSPLLICIFAFFASSSIAGIINGEFSRLLITTSINTTALLIMSIIFMKEVRIKSIMNIIMK